MSAFWRGVASLFGWVGHTNDPLRHRIMRRSDYDAIRADWEAVFGDWDDLYPRTRRRRKP